MSQFRFSIDRGGTFTDVYAEWKDASGATKTRVLKLLSVDPEHYPDAPREAIRRILEEVTGVPHPLNKPLDSSRIHSIRMGTTVATNALLERKGERIAFVVTRGFRDLLQIGNQSRPEIFDLRISKPDLLYERVVEVDERVAVLKDGDVHVKGAAGSRQKPGSQNGVAPGPIVPYDTGRAEPGVELLEQSAAERKLPASAALPHQGDVIIGITGERIKVLESLDLNKLRADLNTVYAAGIRSVAVCLMHSYTFVAHELAVGKLAREIGFTHVSLSHECMPMVKMVPRAFTTCADAYLTPAIQRYITQFTSGFDELFLSRVKVAFMQSDGGLSSIKDFNGYRAILSGPAGGVVGYASTTYDAAHHQPVIGFDMGGTSTDVSRFDGIYEHVFETVTAGVAIQAPQLDINTVAAGGGSILFFRSGMFVVGPESAGAYPGPICYRRHGSTQLTITDANLYLGRIRTENFPRIFGPNQDQGLDEDATRTAFLRLTDEINAYYVKQFEKQCKEAELDGVNAVKPAGPIRMTPEEVAFGFVNVANEAMCRPIRALTQARGYSITNHILACFGGAGGQHACALARSLGMKTIFIHRYSGILSAYGIHLADVVSEAQEPCTKQYTVDRMPFFLDRLDVLADRASKSLLDQGFSPENISTRAYLNLRYHGTDTAIMVSVDSITGLPFGSRRSRKAAVPASSAAAVPATSSGQSGAKQPAAGSDSPASSRNRRRKEKKKARQQDVRVKLAGKQTGDAAQHVDENSFLSEEKRDEQCAANNGGGGYLSEFRKIYLREYGFVLHRPVIVDDFRVRAIGHTVSPVHQPSGAAGGNTASSSKSAGASVVAAAGVALAKPTSVDGLQSNRAAAMKCRVYFESGWCDQTEIWDLAHLAAGQVVNGPAVLLNNTSTIVIEPGCSAEIVSAGDVRITVGDVDAKQTSTDLDPIQLSIFGHRFMSIAEQMGRTLQRTAISTNIKERLDFSCALFGPDGGLVANAPHLPVHLGAMQEAVKYQIKAVGSNWRDGDVIVSNHPMAGGSHLPDITVITPVFAPSANQAGAKPVFFVASRGHHADIGGISPGSMPPFSKYLYQEGAAMMTFKLVSGGEFDEKGITEVLMSPAKVKTGPNETPCSGTRNLHDNLSDLRAQVAANQKGIALMGELIQEKSLPVVQAYMYHIQAAAEQAVRTTLCDISHAHGLKPADTLHATDFMDDGTEIKLALTIDRKDGSALFDFTGTGPQVFGNTNAPKAVTFSAIIYCLRCLVKRDIPLNQGCLNSVRITIPDGTILNPSADAAVVGGNVLTSQRVTDVVLQAFQACAASQGCMNNLTFGDETFGYYETIAGGAGAGPGWHGQSGVHTHMTNTRITDPEVLERRYPALVREFSLRPGSGGAGRYRGGDGVVRDIEFLRPVSVGILSERRNYRPYGLRGGDAAACGMNLLITAEGKILNLTGKNTYAAKAGDRIRVMSPGGGGYGSVDMKQQPETMDASGVSGLHNSALLRTSGSVHAYKLAQESV